MKKSLLVLALAFIFCLMSAVTWQVALTDSYGDGWNGGTLTVYVNGNPVLTNITLAAGGGPAYFNFTVANGDGVTTDHTEGGWPYENSYYIYDHNGNQVAAMIGAYPDGPGDITTPIIVDATGLLNPDNFTATTVSQDQIDLSWDLDSDNHPVMLAWSSDGVFGTPVPDYAYTVGEAIVGGGQVLYLGGNASFSHTGLPPSTTYYYMIWSYAVSKAVVYTPGVAASAATFDPPVTSFPYLTNFDNPVGWTTSLDYPWYLTDEGLNPTAVPYSPTYMADFNCWSYTYGATGYLTTPPLNLPNDLNAVSFWMFREANGPYSTNTDHINVYYSTSGGLSKAYTLLGTYHRHRLYTPPEAADGWYQYTLPLPTGSQGNNRFIIFEGVSDYGQDIYIDDVLLTSDDGTVPVELSSFTAVLTAENDVSLTWVTQSETNVQGYYILRNTTEDAEGALLVSQLIDGTNTSEEHSYSFTDSEIFEPGTYYYWLQSEDFGGSGETYGPVTVSFSHSSGEITPEIPTVTELKSIYPNPFHLHAVVPFSLKESARVQIRVYNSRGQLLRHFDLAEKAAGTYQLAWDGKDIHGRDCGSGVYYFIMQAGDKSFQRKAVLLK